MFLMYSRANKYTNQMLYFLIVMYVSFCLVLGSVVGLLAASVLCYVGWVVFSVDFAL